MPDQALEIPVPTLNVRWAHSEPVVVATPRSPTFQAFITGWLSLQVQWRDSSRAHYEGIVRNHLLPAFGSTPVADITSEEVQDLRAQLRTLKNLSAGCVNQILCLLAAAMSEAADRYGFESPTLRVRRLKTTRSEVHPFTLDELSTLFRMAPAEHRPMLVAWSSTGLRTGEMAGLERQDVDLQGGCVHVRRSFSHGRVGPPKTAESARVVQLNRLAIDAFARQLRTISPASSIVFPSAGGKRLEVHNFAQRTWYPLLAHAEVKRRRPYQLRHTAATLWLAAGENPEWIARQLGHTTTQRLFQTYSRFVPNLLRRDGERFEQAVGNALAQSALFTLN
jgi:integrase